MWGPATAAAAARPALTQLDWAGPLAFCNLRRIPSPRARLDYLHFSRKPRSLIGGSKEATRRPPRLAPPAPKHKTHYATLNTPQGRHLTTRSPHSLTHSSKHHHLEPSDRRSLAQLEPETSINPLGRIGHLRQFHANARNNNNTRNWTCQRAAPQTNRPNCKPTVAKSQRGREHARKERIVAPDRRRECDPHLAVQPVLAHCLLAARTIWLPI